LAHPGEFFANFRESLLNFVEEYGILPRRILVSKEETLQILEPIASILSIRLDMVELLEAAEEFKGEFLLFSYYSTRIMQQPSLPKMRGGRHADVLLYFKCLTTKQIW